MLCQVQVVLQLCISVSSILKWMIETYLYIDTMIAMQVNIIISLKKLVCKSAVGK